MSATDQAKYESRLEEFLSAHPEPVTVNPDATVDEQNQYWQTMADWWAPCPGTRSQANGDVSWKFKASRSIPLTKLVSLRPALVE